MLKALRYLFAKPDAFPDDPYGYLTNQLGHGALGVMLTTVFAWLCLRITGEWQPQQAVVVFTVLTYFLVWECYLQGWRGWDSIEDTLFVFYGASLFLFIDMYFIIDRLLVFFIGAAALLSYGVTKRLKRGRFDA